MTNLSPFLRYLAALEKREGRGKQRAHHGTYPGPDVLPTAPGRWVPWAFQSFPAHRSCSRACVTTRSHMWVIFLCSWSRCTWGYEV